MALKKYEEWLAECKTHDDLKKDKLGGIIPTDKKKAKHVDLITLPQGMKGTNCFNCKYIEKEEGGVGWCFHPDVEMHVNERQCCKYWDAEGTYRVF